MSERLRVDAPATLLAFVGDRLDGWSRSRLKERLKLGCVRVNGEPITQHDHPLRPGDEVTVHAKGEAATPKRAGGALITLHNDGELIVVDKPPGLLSVPTNQGSGRTALSMVRNALTHPRSKKRITVWPVHRLDRETSGVLVLTTSRDLCKAIQRNWSEAEKAYLAVVSGRPSPPEGLIDQPVWEDPSLNVHVGAHASARDARTRYATAASGKARTLLDVRLETGRRHQIRAHLAWLGHPVVGDKRYGVDGLGTRMGLHARHVSLTDPRSGKRMSFDADPGDAFRALLTR